MDYGAVNVLCPFYKDETRNSIRCEGIVSDACVNNYADVNGKRAHKRNYCCSSSKTGARLRVNTFCSVLMNNYLGG